MKETSPVSKRKIVEKWRKDMNKPFTRVKFQIHNDHEERSSASLVKYVIAN